MADEGDVAAAYAHEEASIEGKKAEGEVQGRGSSLRATAEDVRGTMGDAEDESAALLTDLVDAIFEEMRVREENERSVRVAVEASWELVLDGARMAATNTMETMDALWAPQVRPAVFAGDEMPKARPTRLINGDGAPVVAFLAQLWHFLESQSPWVEKELVEYPSSRFRLSAAPSHGRQGEWEIPASELGAFLRWILRGASLGVLSSVADVVVVKNAGLLAKKVMAKAKLQLPQIMMCVQTALLAAEEEHEENVQKAMTQSTKVSLASVFKTEVSHSAGILKEDELLAFYDEGLDFSPPNIDRAATGSLARKSELASTIAKKQKMAKNVVALLRCRESSETKWNALRKRVFVKDHHLGIVVEKDVEIGVGESSNTFAVSTGPSVSPTKRLSITSGPKPSPLKTFSEHDIATLANIFSLGTPRQLSADELARRNDILTLLEREEAQATRKMAVASITAVSVPSPCIGQDGKPIMSEHDKVFQEYAAANSSITMTRGSCHVPSTTAVARHSAEMLRKSKVVEVSGGGPNGRTKFELALEHPKFDVFDGSAYAKILASANPTPPTGKQRRTPVRELSPVISRSSPVSPPSRSRTPQPPSPRSRSQNQYNPRPLDSASGHLPQLDTSRLAVGVKAVVRSIEKPGPRHSPSRNSRLRMHNYTSHAGAERYGGSSPKTVKTTAPSHPRLPDGRDHLPPVSPVTPSIQKKHVTFSTDPVSPPQNDKRPQPPTGLGSPQPPIGPRRFPTKQPTWEERTSPPRVRNRHFTVSPHRKTSRATAGWNIDDNEALHAPRRNVLIPHNDYDDD